MVRRFSPLLLLLVLMLLGSSALALTPDQVLVVANAQVPESLAVAAYYARMRQMDPSQVVAVKTTGGYFISREDYESQILQPLRATLLRRGLAVKIRCLVLTWGVPLHVMAPKNPTGDLLAAEATKAHYRLAVDYKLLATVGRKFPPPHTDGLTLLAELFDSPTPVPPEPLPDWAALLKDIDTLLPMKLRELGAIQDEPHRAIASRQLMALHLEIHGLEGLIRFLGASGLPGAPPTASLQAQLQDARTRLESLRAKPADVENTKALLAALQEIGGVASVGAYCLEHKPSTAVLDAADASVDSELALLWWGDVPLDRQIPNPLGWKWRPPPQAAGRLLPPVLLTARIDGPNSADAMRIIRDSVATEKEGLVGIFYIDSGGPERAKNYDATFRDLHRFVLTQTHFPAVLDESAALFAPDTCPNAALYVGWYSLQKYIPAFRWKTGAVGWHVASFEAMHLRDPSSPEWCPQMIRSGVAATIGAVAEPTLVGFPLPNEFFPLLMTGQYTIAECYWRTVPVVSWRMMLIADPLYNPFKVNPQVTLEALPPGLAPPAEWGTWPIRPPSSSASAPAMTTASAPAASTAPISRPSQP